MLDVIFYLFTILTFIFMLISFLPLSHRSETRGAGDEIDNVEYKTVIPIFAFVAAFFFAILALMAVYIEIPVCTAAISSITVNGNVSNYTYVGTSGNYTSPVLSCDYLTYKDAWPLSWLFGGLSMFMLVYAIMMSVMSGLGTLVRTVSNAT